MCGHPGWKVCSCKMTSPLNSVEEGEMMAGWREERRMGSG